MPFCPNCGNQVAAEAPSCPNCGHPRGAPVQQQGYSPPTPYAQPGYGTQAPYGFAGPRRTEGTAVASLVLGIAGFVVCPIICSIVAIVLGNQAKQRIAQDPSLEGDGMAKAGVILGWVGLGLMGLLMVFWILAFVVAAGGSGF